MSTRTTIHADEQVPMIRTGRVFDAGIDEVVRAHTDPDLFRQWVGRRDADVAIEHWDARTGGSWSFSDGDQRFHGSFHEVARDRIVQTFTRESQPDVVLLETWTFIDLGDGRTRLVGQTLADSFETRDAVLATMRSDLTEGYEKLDALLGGVTVR